MFIRDVILEEYGPAGSRALATGNFQDFINHYQGRKRAPGLKLSFGTSDVVEIPDAGVEALVNYYNQTLVNNDQKRDFVYGVLANSRRMIDLLDKLNIEYARHGDQGQQPSLLEKKQSPRQDPDRSTVTDPRTLMALRKSFARYPTAKSDIEAYMRDTIDQQAETDRDLEQQVATNQAQERNLDRLKDIARRQSQQLTKLDQENDQQEKELQDLEKQLDNLSAQRPTPAAAAERPKKARTVTPPPATSGGAAPAVLPISPDEPEQQPTTSRALGQAAQGLARSTGVSLSPATGGTVMTTPTGVMHRAAAVPGQIGADTAANDQSNFNAGTSDIDQTNIVPFPARPTSAVSNQQPGLFARTGTRENQDLSRMRTLAGLPSNK